MKRSSFQNYYIIAYKSLNFRTWKIGLNYIKGLFGDFSCES